MNYLFGLIRNLSDNKILVLLISLGFLIYFNSLFNGFVGDDLPQIRDNTYVHSINILPFFSRGTLDDKGSGQTSNYYKPVTTSTYALLYLVGSGNPFIFHLTSVLLHISNSFILFLVFKKFFSRTSSIALSLIFLTHPMNVEAVSYIASLQELLFMAFGLLALHFAMNKTKHDNFLIPLFLTLSIFSKETGILFLILMPLFAYFFKKGILKKDILQSVGILAGYLLLRFFIAHVYFNSLVVSPVMNESFFNRLLNIPSITIFYLKTFIFPLNLVMYQNWLVEKPSLNNFYFPIVLISAILLLLFFFGKAIYEKNKKTFTLFLFFSFWLATGILLHLQIFPLDQIVADRWFYFPMIGLLGLAGLLFNFLRDRIRVSPEILMVVFLLIIILFSMRVIMRNSNWKDDPTLAMHDIQYNPKSFQLEDALGAKYFSEKNYTESEFHYKKSTEFFPGVITFTNLGYSYYVQGEKDKARNTFYKALEYGDLYRTYNNLALLLLSMNRLDEAETVLLKGIKTFPKDYELWIDLGITRYLQGKKDQAIDAAQKAYELYPSENYLQVINGIQNNQKVNIQ